MDENSEQEQEGQAAAADEPTAEQLAAASNDTENPSAPVPAATPWAAPPALGWAPTESPASWTPPFPQAPYPEPPLNPTLEGDPLTTQPLATQPLGAGDTPPLGVAPIPPQPTPAYGQPPTYEGGVPPVPTQSTPAYGQPPISGVGVPGGPSGPGMGGPGGPPIGGTPMGSVPMGAPGDGTPAAGGPSWPPPPYGYAGGGWFTPPPPPEPPRRSRRGVALLLVGALVAGGVGASLGAAFAPHSSNNALQPSSGSVTPSSGGSSGSSGALSTAVITRLVSPAVVDINTVVATESGEPQQEAAGTGMIVTSNGTILTNNHVIEDAQKISVVIAGRSYPATVLGTAKSSDVALIKVSGVSGLPTVSLGNSNSIDVGDAVVAIGNALGLGGTPSSAPGYISKTDATITANGEGDATQPEQLSGLFETNAEIQPGDSGGPLVDGKGQVIGMDTAAAQSDSGSSVGFAIPIATARAIALKIENRTATKGIVLGLSPYMGIFFPSSPTTGLGGTGLQFGIGSGTCPNGTTANTGTASNGITLSGVAAGGPAALAGLTAGDVVTAIAGHATTTETQVLSSLAGLKPGQHIAVAYTDDCGTAHTTAVTLGGIPA